MSKKPTTDLRRGLSDYINYVADASNTENRMGNRAKEDGSIGRVARRECMLCGGEMYSFQYALCWHCSQKKNCRGAGQAKKTD